MESLPSELMDMLLASLSLADTSRLSRCGKALRPRLLPTLYASPALRSQAMKWACEHGAIEAVRLAVAHGAPIGVVALPRKRREAARDPEADPGAPPTAPSPLTFTLHLAAKHGHTETFRVLIELGAGLDDRDVDPATVRAFVHRLFRRFDPELVNPFLNAGLLLQLTQEMRDEALLSLLATAKPAPLDLVRRLLEGGASPNCLRTGHGTRPSCSPLSLAVLSEQNDLFELLLEKGADVNGVPAPHPLPRRSLHVPLCAAAYASANGAKGLIQLCLDRGADVNVRVPFIRHLKTRAVSFTTPLMVYLDALGEWDQDTGPAVAESLLCLLEHGARLQIDPGREDDPVLRNGRYRLETPHSAVEIILDKWSIYKLTQPSFLSVIKELVEHGGFAARTGEILSKLDCPSQDSEPGPALVRAWQDLLSMILASDSYHEPLDEFLRAYILQKGRQKINHSFIRTISELTRITVLRLIEAGAQIDARPSPQHSTALHELCWHYSKAEFRILGRSMGLARWIDRLTTDRVEFLRFLVEQCGADPAAKWSQWDKRAPTETLRLEWDILADREKSLVEQLQAFLEEASYSRSE